MTGDEIKMVRAEFGLSIDNFAKLLGVAAGRTVQRWESGESDIPGPVEVLLDLLLTMPDARARTFRRQLAP